jgi:lipopolysaccharide biosynthesis protein
MILRTWIPIKKKENVSSKIVRNYWNNNNNNNNKRSNLTQASALTLEWFHCNWQVCTKKLGAKQG